MASSISIPPRGSRSSSPRPPPHYKFTILAPDVYAPKSIKYVPSEDSSYGFCQFLMGKFESHFGMRCTMPTVASAAFFGDFNEFEDRFLVDAEYIVIVITAMSLKVFKKFYPRLLVFVTVRPEWVNRFIFVMVGDIMLEPSVDLTVFFHEPIFFKETGWEADIETWKNLHVLLKVEWSPMKDKPSSPRCGDVVSIIQRTVVETEVQEIRTRRRTDSRRSEGGSTPGNLSPLRPARPVSTTSTPSSPTPLRMGGHLSKSTDSQLFVMPPTKEKALEEFNDAGEAVTSSARPTDEKRRSPFLGRRTFGGRAKILVEEDLPKPRVHIERAPEVQIEERRRRRNTGGEEQVFAETMSKLESHPQRKRSPEKKERKKLLVGTENLNTEVCIVENIAIDGLDGDLPPGGAKMDVDVSGTKRPAEEVAEEVQKRKKTNDGKMKSSVQERTSDKPGKTTEETMAPIEKGATGGEFVSRGPNSGSAQGGRTSSESKKNGEAGKQKHNRPGKEKAISEKEKLIAMETGESHAFIATSKEIGTEFATSDYSSLNSSASSSRPVSAIQSPPPPCETVIREINIEDRKTTAPESQPWEADVAKKSTVSHQAIEPKNQQKDANSASVSRETKSEVTERPANPLSNCWRRILLSTYWRRILGESEEDPLHRPIPVFLILATVTFLSPYYHSISSAAFSSLMSAFCTTRIIPSTVAILPAAVVAALPETGPQPPPASSAVLLLLSPFLLPGEHRSNAEIDPQKLFFFRVVRGP